MCKKIYKKPELKTHKVELGVYGSYSDRRPGHHGHGAGTDTGGNCDIDPVGIIGDLDLHME